MGLDSYSIDPAMSRFTVRAFASGMLSALGHSPTLAVRGFTGTAQFAPDAPDSAGLHMKVDAGSLSVTDNVSEKDRREIERTMNVQVLDTARYPEILYDTSRVSASKVSEGQYAVNMVGDLSLHGMKKSEPVAAQVLLTGDILRAHGEFSILQTDYGIKPVSVAGGAIKLKDELKCTFDILARKAASQ
jgi:polyisoprenoid-binding protein YceI